MMVKPTMEPFSIKILIITVATLASLVRSEDNDQKINTDLNKVHSSLNRTNLEITCYSEDWVDFLGKYDLPRNLSVRFVNCSVPKTIRVQSLLQSMNINGFAVVKDIEFSGRQTLVNAMNLDDLSTPQLVVSLNDSNYTPFNLLYYVKNLTKLRISNGQLRHIPWLFFADWAKNIVTLELNNTKLQIIGRIDFAELVNVETLNLKDNEIDEIEPGAFSTLVRLKYLNLENNRLHTLPPGIFHQLGRLNEISLSSNLFDELSQDLFERTKSLTSFSMNNNKGELRTLPGGFFKNLADLKTVHILNSHLESIPSDLFAGCSNLSNINLSTNQIRNLPTGLFNDARNLETLEIAFNRLESLPFKLTQDVLERLQSLKYLVASNNNLSRIDSRLITHLKSARRIDLSNNQLTFESPEKSLSSSMNTPNGTITNISVNQTIPDLNLDSSVQLKHVDLRENKIAQINAEVINILKYSNYIDLSYNHISTINMSELSSALNERKRIKTNVAGSDENLMILLSNNPLKCDCRLIDFVRYLTSPNKNDANGIVIQDDGYNDRFTCASPPEFQNRNVHTIQPEELSCLLKTSVPGDACNGTCLCRENPVKQVLSVDCSYRNLTRLPAKIVNGHNWSIELNMIDNLLQEASSLGVSYLTNVTSLDLSNNNISKVTLDLFSPRLQHLKLHGNNISSLDSKVIEYLKNDNNTLMSITLHNNKWICDCGTRQFLNLVQTALTRYDFQKITCDGSKRKLHEMTENELCNVVMIIIASLGIAFVLGLIVVGCIALYFKERRRKLGWLYYYL